MRQHNGVIRFAPDGDFSSAKPDRLHSRHGLDRRAAAIVKGQRNQFALLVANTEQIAVDQRFLKGFFAANLAPLIEQPVRCAGLAGMRVNQGERVPLARNLEMEARNRAIVNYDVVGWVASDSDRIPEEGVYLALAGIAEADLERRRAQHSGGNTQRARSAPLRLFVGRWLWPHQHLFERGWRWSGWRWRDRRNLGRSIKYLG